MNLRGNRDTVQTQFADRPAQLVEGSFAFQYRRLGQADEAGARPVPDLP